MTSIGRSVYPHVLFEQYTPSEKEIVFVVAYTHETPTVRLSRIVFQKFAVISAIVLPLLPNQTFGPPPFDIFNPYHIWLFVVLISGISFFGYLLMKFIPPEHSINLTGLLGGLASSTATTLIFAQLS